MLIFLASIYKTINSNRRIPSPNYTIPDRAFRGGIFSADEYTLADSQKTYQAVIRGASIDPNKRELFIKLFSIYSGIPEDKIKAKFINKENKYIKSNIILSNNINLLPINFVNYLYFVLSKPKEGLSVYMDLILLPMEKKDAFL